MFLNYLKIALRNLRKNKSFSVINIFGLATGLASCLLIMLYIFDENGYDKHHKDGDSIFRIFTKDNQGDSWVSGPAPLAFLVKNNLPEVEQSARLLTFPDIAKILIKYQNGADRKQFFETNGYYVDSNFFQILTYKFIYGNAQTALAEPNTLVISKEMSDKFFGNINPVGKVLLLNTAFGEFNYTVKAVFDSKQYKSHIPANYFLSMRNNDMWSWVKGETNLITNNIFYTYLKLKKGTDSRQFEKKLQSLYEKEAGAELKAAGISKTLFLQPVKDIYLHSSLGNEIAANGSATYLYILASIAAFILIIACINFMNLSTARSEKRAKEVGVRKTIGAQRSSLIWQFLTESLIMCLLSLLLAMALVKMMLPYFNNLTQKNIGLFNNPGLFVWIAGLTLLTGLLAGLYPAFYLSGFRPALIFKRKTANNFSVATLRKGLVVFQFTISICLVFAAVVIWNQIDYLKSEKLGFNKSQQLILPLQDGYLNNKSNYTALKDELLKYPEIKLVSSGSAYPGITNINDMVFYGGEKTVNDNIDIHLSAIENDYLETLGIRLLSGRMFSKDFSGDSASIIINETAMKKLGYTLANAIGKKIKYDLGRFHGALQIAGVVKDFNFESLHSPIQPYGFTTSFFGNKYGYVIAGLNTKDYATIIKKVQQAWTRLFPAVPFNYSFLDQDFQRNYESEVRTSRIVSSFTIIDILIACLGLFGLSAFSAEQRTKEIGIRKVLGASISQVAILLSKNFLSLVAIAIVIALPLAGWMMNKWLREFAYRIQITWFTFALSGFTAILIALLTISFQSIKAAIANPVKSLRTE